jgi:DNA-binding response OmpR family regulator
MSLSPLEVFLVEDKEDFSRMLRRVLSPRAGVDPDFACQMAASLVEGLAMFKDWSFDAVILDMNLRDRQGLETLRSSNLYLAASEGEKPCSWTEQ